MELPGVGLGSTHCYVTKPATFRKLFLYLGIGDDDDAITQIHFKF